jgi:hypothetical protein
MLRVVAPEKRATNGGQARHQDLKTLNIQPLGVG